MNETKTIQELLQLFSNADLIRITKNEIDIKTLAFKELEDRGFDLSNKWVGFKN